MRRTTALLACLPLAVALSACGGGGGGSNAAFCEAAEEIEGEDNPSFEEIEEVADAAPDELDDQFELLIDFLEAAEEGDADALEEFDEDDVEEAADDIEAFAEEECDVELDDEDEDAEDEDAEDDSTTTTEAPDDDADEDEDATGELPDAASPPDLDDPTEALLAEDCEDGDLAACDELFAITDVGSDGETYGATCGGRVDEDEAQAGNCTGLFGEDVELGDPSTPPDLDDPEEAELAEACFEGDLGSCDELFRITAVDSDGETYGATCGGRVEESDDLRNQCEATFG